MKIMNELGKRVSPSEHRYDDHELFLEDVVRPAGLTYRQFVEKGCLKGPERFRLFEKKGFRTPSGKVELKLITSEKFKLKPLSAFEGFPEEDPDSPLLLRSAKNRYYLLSSYRWEVCNVPWIKEESCTGCGVCIEECPAGAIAMEDEKTRIDMAECIRCGTCHDACPEGAVRHDSETIPLAEASNVAYARFCMEALQKVE